MIKKTTPRRLQRILLTAITKLAALTGEKYRLEVVEICLKVRSTLPKEPGENARHNIRADRRLAGNLSDLRGCFSRDFLEARFVARKANRLRVKNIFMPSSKPKR